jgi:hypothetical protein
MSTRRAFEIGCLCATLVMTACQTNRRSDSAPARDELAGKVRSLPKFSPPHETLERILALDPEHVTEADIREVLAGAPAPRIMNIHGGLLPLQGSMASFSEFLVGMGYPRASIRNPADGSYAFGYYVNSEEICGVIAWYYEREGLRPMIVGHSQGGIQAVKILYKLAGDSTERIAVRDPLTWKSENRYDLMDPLTGRLRPVVGLRIPFATAVVAGGLGRALPNQWLMYRKLRKIPDSVEEFTGFQKGLDILGGDWFGYGPANDYKSCGKASVRNVRLPSSYAHTTIPSTRHLLKSQQIKDWINEYQPGEMSQLEMKFDSNSSHVLWAAEVWHSIKKHWVLELQRLLQATRSNV